MDFRFDYSTFFWLLPLDVHNLIFPYIGAVRKNFSYSKTTVLPHNFELRKTKYGSVVVKHSTGMRHCTYKSNGCLVAIGGKIDAEMYEKLGGKMASDCFTSLSNH